MAYEIPGFRLGTHKAASDLSAKQYHFVKLDSSGNVAAIAAATDVPLGILQNTPGSLHAADVMTQGVSKLVAGGSLAAAALVGTDADGKGTAYTYGASGTAGVIMGQVLTGNTTANGIVTVDLDTRARGA